MAVRFRFTPVCCCGDEPQGCFPPCIPGCSVLFDGIANYDDTVTPFMTLVADSRLCSGDSFWRGFRVYLGYASPETDNTITAAMTNNIVWAFGYSHGVRNSIQTDTDEQGHVINVYQTDGGALFDFNASGADWTVSVSYYPGRTGLSLVNNNNAGFADYFVYSAIDGRYHYDPDVYEPVWTQLFATPFDWTLCFDMESLTAENWAAAPSKILGGALTDSYYSSLEDCGFARLTVYADFATDHDAREVSHTESCVQNYITDGDEIQTFLDGLIGAHETDLESGVPGVHHYGSGRFTLDYFGLRAPYKKISYSVLDDNLTCPTGASAFCETHEGRYYLDAPDFTPMLPADVYAVDNTKTVPVDQSDPTQGTYTSYQKFGDRTVPVNLWSGESTPWTEGTNGFLGDYIASARFYSYAPSILTSAAYTSRNSFLTFGKEWNGRANLFGRQCRYRFPLGRYTFTLPSSSPSPMFDPSIRIATAPFYVYKLTLDKANYDFTWDDFNFIVAHYPSQWSGSYDEIFTDSLAILEQETLSSDQNYDEPSGVLLGWKRGAVPASASGTTPAALVQYNQHVIYYKADRLGVEQSTNYINGWGYGTANKVVNSVRSHFQTMGIATSRSLGTGDLLAADASVDNIPIPAGVNTCIGSYTLGWRTIANPNDGKTYIIPSVPKSVIDDLMADAYVIVGPTSAEAGASYYYYPYIWITGYLIYNPDKHYPYESSGGNI